MFEIHVIWNSNNKTNKHHTKSKTSDQTLWASKHNLRINTCHHTTIDTQRSVNKRFSGKQTFRSTCFHVYREIVYYLITNRLLFLYFKRYWLYEYFRIILILLLLHIISAGARVGDDVFTVSVGYRRKHRKLDHN